MKLRWMLILLAPAPVAACSLGKIGEALDFALAIGTALGLGLLLLAASTRLTNPKDWRSSALLGVTGLLAATCPPAVLWAWAGLLWVWLMNRPACAQRSVEFHTEELGARRLP